MAAKAPVPNPAPGLRSSLHERGQRLTPQRQKVLALFEQLGEGRHLSAEDVHHRLGRGADRVSLATVYRTLRLLSSLGLLQELELPEGGVVLSWPVMPTPITTIWSACAAGAPRNSKVVPCWWPESRPPQPRASTCSSAC